MGPTIITTARIALRAWDVSDVAKVVELLADPEVVRYINRGESVSADAAREFVDRQMRTQRERGWCRWAIELHEQPGRLGGFCGPGCTFAPDVELGWTLRRDLWRRGLATEAATGALAFCFGVVGFDEIVAAIDSRNSASERVARRLGMVPSGSYDLPGLTVTRWAIANPLADPPRDPRFIRNCDGERSGSSLRPPDDDRAGR